MTVQYWLAELDQHGNPKLTDGSHSEPAGVEQALYLLKQLGLARGKTYAMARVELREVTAQPHGANQEAIEQLNAIGLR